MIDLKKMIKALEEEQNRAKNSESRTSIVTWEIWDDLIKTLNSVCGFWQDPSAAVEGKDYLVFDGIYFFVAYYKKKDEFYDGFWTDDCDNGERRVLLKKNTIAIAHIIPPEVQK